MAEIQNFLRVQAAPEKATLILAAIADDTVGIGSIDFGKITPMPPWVFSGALDKETAEIRSEDSWLAWRQENWGTRWNAIDPQQSADLYDGKDTICFRTRDTDVRGLMARLSLMFSHVAFDYVWASEDVGKDAGALQFQNGNVLFSHIPVPESRAAYELAFDVLHTSAEEYGLRLDPCRKTYFYTASQIKENGVQEEKKV